MTHQLLQEHADLATAIDILDKWVAHAMKKSHQPGLALGLVHDGELLWGSGYGVADLETKKPVTAGYTLPYREYHQDVHRHRHIAAARCGQALP